jgi:hypothetical protein
LKDPLPTRNPESSAEVLGQEESLVEAALPQALGMKGDRDQEIEKIDPPVIRETARHPFSQKRGDVNLPLIFPSVNGFPQRTFIGSYRSTYCKIPRFLQTNATGMVSGLPGRKRNAAPGAKGRFNPVEAGQAAAAKPLLAFGQEGFTAVTLGGQKKLKQGLEE